MCPSYIRPLQINSLFPVHCLHLRDSITEMLTSLEWPPFQLRRKFARLTLLYKIIHSLTEIPNSYLPKLSPVTITRCNHEQKFLHYHTSIDNYKYSIDIFFQEQYQNGMDYHKTSSTNTPLTASNNYYTITFNFNVH